METREITLAAIIAALYSALVIVLAPISFGPIQLRVADCLIPLAALLGWPAVYGVSLGAFIGNAYFMQYTGPLDVVLGALANLVAAALIFRLRRSLMTACLGGSVVIGVVVGGYLWIYFPPPDIAGLNLPIWLAMIVSITLSSVVTVAGIGFLLVKALTTSGINEMLESLGLKTHLE
ncbi:MAG: QueT transporter family protein [Candidatus Bathyarchaeota archaeon]|nr:MAG: QueT transporter family protein [Candidatus Bathyarchaeota archaeon]